MSESKYAIRPNKTQIKREVKALNNLGKELIAMPDSALKKVPISEAMRFEIKDGKRFSHGPLQRQLRRIAGLMQHEDIEAIQQEIARQKAPSKQQTAEFHQLEQWRDRLIAGDEKLLTKLIDQYSVIDRQHIRQLVRNAGLELKKEKPPKSARALFKYLTQVKLQTPKSDDTENDQAKVTD
ncbi:MAG: ribosome-associated protein [Cryomorphaceae bacterium]|jgi:ribosome-associated protein